MSWYHRLLNLVRSDRVSRDIDRELAFHVAEAEDELIAAGLSPEAAAREARRRFGNYGLQKERTRDADVLPWLESLLGDMRYALRALRASPALALVAILSLGLGIGANTAIFSLINAVLLRPLPVPNAQELVLVSSMGLDGQAHARSGHTFTNPLWEQLRDRQNVFSGVFAVGGAAFDVSRGSETRVLRGNWVSGAMFGTLGVRPVQGRVIQPDDDKPGCAPIAVLSHSYWQSEFGGAADVVGRTITLNSHPVQVVGVTEARFAGVMVGQSANVYVPICAIAVLRTTRAPLEHRSMWWLRVLGRPQPGLTLPQLNARLAVLAPPSYEATVADHYSTEARKEYLSRTLVALSAPGGISYVRDDYRKALLVLMGIVGVVLLIACANVANLLLARATTRQGEVAIRLALGASRLRLVRQLLTESLLLSFLGAAAGVLFARWSSRFLLGFISTQENVVTLDLSLDPRVLGFTVLVATLTGVMFGLAPAWRARHIDPQHTLRGSGRTLIGGRSRFNLGRTLVVTQVALSLVLVAGAGLLMSTFWRLATLDPGFRRNEVLITTLNLRRANVPQDQASALYARIRTRLEALPAVRSTSMSEYTPIDGGYWNEHVLVDGFTPKSDEDATAYFNSVGDRYFETLGMRLLAGRDFNAGDGKKAEPVAVVNQTMALRFFGSANVVGRQLRVKRGDGAGPAFRIVGVVSDAKIVELREQTAAGVYLPITQRESPSAEQTFLLSARGSLDQLPAQVRAAVGEFSSNIGISFTTLDAQISGSIRRERLLATLSGFFGGAALLLAMVGIYGIMSYHVSQRRREIGVRMAFGAARHTVLRMVFTQIGGMVAVGVVIGLAGAIASTRLVSSFLYGVEPNEPGVLIVATLLLVAVAALAGFLPARRAARLDPMIALRED